LKHLLLAILAGLSLAFAFPPHNLWLLAPIAWALFIYLLHKLTPRQRFYAGFTFGFSFWIIHINWLVVLGFPVLLITAIAISIFYGIFSIATALFRNSSYWLVGYSLVFLSLEVMLNYWPLGGFNWGSLGYIAAEHPLTPLVEITGVFGLSIFIMSLSIVFILMYQLINRGGFTAALASFLIWMLASGLISIFVEQNQNAPTGELTIVAIQGNVPRLGLEFNAQRKAVYENHVRETEKALAANPNLDIDLVVWPENAPDVDPFRNPEVIDELNRLALRAGAPLLVGSRMQSDLGAINASILITGDTTKENAFIYAKQKLVPFGERIPLERYLAPVASNFGPLSENLVAGEQPGVLQIDQSIIGLMICFEVAWGQVAYEAIAQQAEVLLIQTNNATYGLTGQLDQQFNIAKLRSIESQKEVITVATSGISGHIDNSGLVKWQAPEFQAASEVLNVKLYQGMNVGLKANYYLQILVVILAFALAVYSVIRGRIKHYVK
jgi:apolipoprotein N-acyltransferase